MLDGKTGFLRVVLGAAFALFASASAQAGFDKMRMLANVVRETHSGMGEMDRLATLVKGAGPVFLKMVQGIPEGAIPKDMVELRKLLGDVKDKRRNPYAKRCALVTPAGSRHPGFENIARARWLELVEAESDRMETDGIALEGPDVAETEADVARQTYRLEKRVCPQGARIVAENLGGNRFKVEAENARVFRILLAPAMGDLARPFTVVFADDRAVTAAAALLAGDRDYAAALTVRKP